VVDYWEKKVQHQDIRTMSFLASNSKKKLYEFQETLGAGSFGTVRKAVVKETGEEVAIKIILKSRLKGHLEAVEREIRLLASISHPNIVRLIDWFETRHNFYIVTQLATGGELFERLVKQTCFTEYDACEIIYQLLCVLDYLHKRGIIHRDIKPENVLYLTKATDSPIVLADFGVSKQTNAKGDQKITGLAGSYGYIAPEVYASEGVGDLYGLGKGGYTNACDIWSLGVVAYTLIGGYSPFCAQTPEEFLDEVRSNNFVVFHQKYWKDISEDAKDYIVKSLDIDNRRRPSAEQLLHHPWILKHVAQKNSTKALPQQRNIITNIQGGFNAAEKLRKAVRFVIMKNKLAKLRVLRKQEGEEFDSDSEDFVFHASPTKSNVVMDFSKLSLDELRDKEHKAEEGARKSRRQQKSEHLTLAFQNLVRLAQDSKERIKRYQDEEDRNSN